MNLFWWHVWLNNPYFEVKTMPQLHKQTCHFDTDRNYLSVLFWYEIVLELNVEF